MSHRVASHILPVFDLQIVLQSLKNKSKTVRIENQKNGATKKSKANTTINMCCRATPFNVSPITIQQVFIGTYRPFIYGRNDFLWSKLWFFYLISGELLTDKQNRLSQHANYGYVQKNQLKSQLVAESQKLVAEKLAY